MVLDSNKWITLFAMAFVVFTGLVIAVVFFIDPFLYYRNISNDKKLMEPRYASIGIIKNYKHDMTILGMDSDNSMDMLYIRNYHEKKPIQIGIEDSNINDVLILYTMSQENSKADFYFINVKPEEFIENIKINLTSQKFPGYLYNKKKLDDIKYLLNYEICFRYIPLNTVIDTAFKLNRNLPVAMKDGTEIDKVVSWKKDAWPVTGLAKGLYKDFQLSGFEITEKKSEKESDSKLTNEEIENRIDSYLNIIFKQIKPGQTIVFGFMPYSVEYWLNVQDTNFEAIMYAKEYFIKGCKSRDNVKIVDLQWLPEISSLNNYTSEQNLNQDMIRLYTDAIFDETIYETSKLYNRNRKSLQTQIEMYKDKQ